MSDALRSTKGIRDRVDMAFLRKAAALDGTQSGIDSGVLVQDIANLAIIGHRLDHIIITLAQTALDTNRGF